MRFGVNAEVDCGSKLKRLDWFGVALSNRSIIFNCNIHHFRQILLQIPKLQLISELWLEVVDNCFLRGGKATSLLLQFDYSHLAAAALPRAPRSLARTVRSCDLLVIPSLYVDYVVVVAVAVVGAADGS